MSNRPGADAFGTIDEALARAGQWLERDAELALRQAQEILRVAPGDPRARLLEGAAQRRAGRTQAALELLLPLAHDQPHAASVHWELGAAFAQAERGAEAIVALQRAVALRPNSADAWRLLADQLDAAGDSRGAESARARFIQAATHEPRLLAAAAALVANDLARAESLLRTHLKSLPTDVAALRMLAEVAARLRRYADAETLLARCLELAPSFDAARHNYAAILNRQGKSAAALAEVQRLLAQEPRNPGYLNLQAAVSANLGDFAQTIAIYETALAAHPDQPKAWMSYGHALKTAGRHDDSVRAYRRALALAPLLGEAYWSLANLKTFRFAQTDVAAMRGALLRPELADDDRLHVEFALGKALEDAGEYAESFQHYAAGNALRRRLHPYEAGDHTRFVGRVKRVFTREFFAARAGCGAPAADPIFIVGLPRAGSTLLEQILASHSAVEGTMELPDVPRIAQEIFAGAPEGAAGFAEAVAALSPADLRALGERYLAATRVQRKTAAPFFIDKMPNNCLYVGLIHLMLPNARIIDARRHPQGCGVSIFKQHFARGQAFAYSLEDIGRYYRDYVELMAHFDEVLQGRVHRVHYESMIEDTEAEVRRLLAHCGLPFEPSCLRFYANERAVRTASSEQVRRPIFREGTDHWRHFEPWLAPLAAALGPVLDAYPAVPHFP